MDVGRICIAVYEVLGTVALNTVQKVQTHVPQSVHGQADGMKCVFNF